jgi:hypothetical protein
MILLFNSFGLAQALKRSTTLSMFYIACCAIVLMLHNALQLYLVADLEAQKLNYSQN